MRWNEYIATLTEADHRRLVVSLGAGLQEARKASEVATSNGQLEDARDCLSTALEHLATAAALLGSKRGA